MSKSAKSDAGFTTTHPYLRNESVVPDGSNTARQDAKREILRTRISRIDQQMARLHRERRDVQAELAELSEPSE